jgi:hypothetical protein
VEQLLIGTWTARGITGITQPLETELEEKKVDIAIPDTKTNLKGGKELTNRVL